MLKVLIVDDEELIREGLNNLIDWHENGYKVVGKVEDGEQALEFMDLLVPDVIITDIKMPFINGLELIERVKNKYENIFFIILSGYDEFQFAQKAIELGAYSYLLKPVEPDMLINTLIKLKSDFENETKSKIETAILKQKAEENEVIAKEKLFKNIIFDIIDCENLEIMLNSFKMNLNNFCVVIVVELDNYYIITKDASSHAKRLIQDSFKNMILLNSFDCQTTIISENNSYSFIIISWNEHEEILKNNIFVFIL